jgi:quercetin dioxygenase-like cupin family protein
MNNIKLIKQLGFGEINGEGGDRELNELFNGPRRRIVEVRLRNGAVLARHHAIEPITVMCLSGKGIFTAGSRLESSQDLRPGTLITLEGGVEHEVSAEPDLHLIVSKFKDS